MNTFDVKRLALVLSVQAEVEAMKTENSLRMSMDYSPAYTEDHFFRKANELNDLANKHDHQL
jgi:hypothetical protein